MEEDTRLLLKLTAIMVLIFVIALNYKEVMYNYRYSHMTKAQKIHELHKLGIPSQKDCE